LISFWATALLIPMIVIVGNASIRWLAKLEPSSFADVILAFVVFDALVIIDHKHFEHYLRNDLLRADIIAIYVILLIINVFLWIGAAFVLEKKLSAAYDRRAKRYKILPWHQLMNSLMVQVFVIFANLASFAYNG
jgi:hypothetical protein